MEWVIIRDVIYLFAFVAAAVIFFILFSRIKQYLSRIEQHSEDTNKKLSTIIKIMGRKEKPKRKKEDKKEKQSIGGL